MFRSLSSSLLLCRRLSHSLKTSSHQQQQQHHLTQNDAYFTVVNHISNIVRNDHYLERTLNRLKHSFLIPLSPSLVLRILNASSSHPHHSLRFFSWLRSSFSSSSYTPTSLEFHSLLLTLARHRLFSFMWALAHQMHSPSLPLPFSPDTFASEQRFDTLT